MIKKPKKDRKKTIPFWRNKSDRLMQEIGRQMYKRCMVCGGTYSCLHHFIPKSRSTQLRYNWQNLIPICSKCHCTHHNGDTRIHAIIQKEKGEDWIDEIMAECKKGIGKYYGYKWYQNIYENLKIMKPYEPR